MSATALLSPVTPPLLILATAAAAARLSGLGEKSDTPVEADPRLYHGYRRAARLCAAVVFGFGIVILAGWIFDIPQWKALIPGGVSIKVNIAVGLILAGVAVLLPEGRKAIDLAATWCGGLVAVIGAATLAEYFLGVSFGIDQLFFLDTERIAANASPGRMAMVTAVVLSLMGPAVLLSRRDERTIIASQYLSLTAWAVCFVTLAGYLFGANVVTGLAYRITMSLQACTACCVLSAGVLLLHPHRGPMRVLTSRAPGGTMARLLLPAALLLPCAIGYVRWIGQREGLYDTAFGLALFASANTVVFVALILGGATLLDILDHARTDAQADLSLRDAQYRTLVESLPQIVWTATPNGRCDYLSRRWYEYTGIDEQRSMGLRWTRVVHEEDREQNSRLWMESVKTGKTFDGEYRVIGADGQYRWFRAIATPMRDDRGNVQKWFGTSMDVEDRRRDENAIRQLNETLEDRVRERTRELADAEAKLKSVLQAATRAAFVAVDTAGKIQMFNTGAERMLGYTEAEMLGKSPLLFHDAEEIRIRCEAMSAQLGRSVTGSELVRGGDREGPGSEGEWTYVRKDGVPIDVILGITPIKNADGELYGYLGVSTEITARKVLERALRDQNEKLAIETKRAEEANHAKSDFLATMSHEIRTPMNAILGMADLLAESNLDAEQRTCVEVFQRAGSNLMSLINDILDLSKIEAGRIELEEADFDVRDVIEQVVELTASKAQVKRLDLHTEVSPDLPAALTGDAMRLRQILINLVGNAIKFTSQGGVVISASFARTGVAGELEFSVRDTGIGIPEAKLGSIFEAFTQADSSTTRQYGGTGLGLAISRRLVESMGGRISVTSATGKGSTFRFTAIFGLSAAPVTRPQVPMEELRGCRVLIIDDDTTSLVVLRHLIGGWGMIATEFSSPRDAIASLKINASTYSLAIVDGEMPGMDGFATAAEIAEIAPNVPVLMLSSTTRPGDAIRSRQQGLAGYAAKPVEKSDLLRMIRQTIRTTTASKSTAESDRGLRILAAEDSADNQMLLRMYLKDQPHQITFVETGAAAVEQRSANEFDLILMDMQMPVMDGLTATRAIRQFEREQSLPPIPVIAFTANASPADIEKSWEAGCNGHLTKPVKRARLLRAIEEYTPADLPRAMEPPAPSRDIQAEFAEMIRSMAPDYIRSVRKDVVKARELLALRDVQALRRLGHNFKGTSPIYGFSDLGKTGGKLEDAAVENDWPAIEREVAALELQAAALPE